MLRKQGNISERGNKGAPCGGVLTSCSVSSITSVRLRRPDTCVALALGLGRSSTCLTRSRRSSVGTAPEDISVDTSLEKHTSEWTRCSANKGGGG